MVDYAFTFNGFTFGGAAGGPAVWWTNVVGLEDSPPVRAADDPRGFADGMFYGRDFLAGRTVTADLQFLPGQGKSHRQVIEQAKAALSPQGGGSTASQVLTFTLPGSAPRRIFCRLRRRAIAMDRAYVQGRAVGAVEFYAADPRIYDEQAQSASISLAARPSGLVFPLTFPLSFGGATAPSSALIVNAGTFNTKPVLTIQGPVDTPVVQNATQGLSLRFNLVLGASDILTVDTDTRAVILNGTASRRAAMSYDSVWWDLQPGPNTVLFAAAAQTTATVSVSWRNAYL